MDFVLALHRQCHYTTYKTLFKVWKEVVPNFEQTWNEIRSFNDLFDNEKLTLVYERFENMIKLTIGNGSEQLLTTLGKLTKIITPPRLFYGKNEKDEIVLMLKREEQSDFYVKVAGVVRREVGVDSNCLSHLELQVPQSEEDFEPIRITDSNILTLDNIQY